jgi:hypothetical protein
MISAVRISSGDLAFAIVVNAVVASGFSKRGVDVIPARAVVLVDVAAQTTNYGYRLQISLASSSVIVGI